MSPNPTSEFKQIIEQQSEKNPQSHRTHESYPGFIGKCHTYHR